MPTQIPTHTNYVFGSLCSASNFNIVKQLLTFLAIAMNLKSANTSHCLETK